MNKHDDWPKIIWIGLIQNIKVTISRYKHEGIKRDYYIIKTDHECIRLPPKYKNLKSVKSYCRNNIQPIKKLTLKELKEKLNNANESQY